MFQSFREVFQRSCALLGIFNNSILVLLILYRSPKKLGNYKYLMIYITIFEIIYSLLDFSTVPEIFSKDYVFLITVEKRMSGLPDFELQGALLIFCNLFGMSMAVFAIHFVYRFLVMTGSQFIKTHHLPKVLGLIAFTLCIGFGWNFLAIANYPIPQSDMYLIKEYLKPRNLQLSDVIYLDPCFRIQDENGELRLNWKAAGSIGTMVVLIGLSLFTVFYCGFAIYKNIKSLSAMRSSTDQSLQSQLFYALVFQTLIPVILMHIPATFGFVFSMFNHSILLFGELPTFCILMYPMLDPLPNSFIIRSYRKAILDFFGFLRKKPSPVSSTNPNLELQPRIRVIAAAN